MTLLWTIFAVIMAGFLIVDLGYLNRKPHAVSTKEATLQSLFWVAISFAFAGGVWALLGHEMAANFVSGYVTEKMLSVDNLFVIMLVFKYFQVEPRYQHRVLLWGILGAVVLRALFIGLGAVIIGAFHWVLYIFGAILVYTGIKIFSQEEGEEEFHENAVIRWARRVLPITHSEDGPHFTIRNLSGKLFLTPLFLALIAVETTDIIFAIDSIPAVFSITQNPFIVFTSNIFAVMGLRALFFLVENIIRKFSRLQQGISVVLIFIGGKMLADIFGIHVSPLVSLAVILGCFGLSLLASILFPKKAT